MKRLLWCLGLAALGFGAAGLAWRERAPEPVHQGRPLKDWLQQLADGDHDERERATAAIQAIGHEAVPGLAELLHHNRSAWDRLLAAPRRRLSFLPPPASSSRQLRERAAEQLGALGRAAPAAVRALVAALDEPDAAIRAEIQRALRRVGSAGHGPLMEALANGRPLVRQGAAQVLGDLSPHSEAIVSALLESIRDRRELVRIASVRALGGLAASRSNVRAGLAAALQDLSPAVRAAAADGLAGAGPALEPAALRALEVTLADADAAARIAAGRALHHLDGRTERVVPVLVGALRDREAGWRAVFVLGEIGPRAAPAVPALVEVLKREQVFRPLRNPPASAVALGRIGPAAAPALAALLREPEPRVRAGAVIALGQIGGEAPGKIPALRTALADPEPEVRRAAALALCGLGLDASSVKPVLTEMVGDEDIFVSSAAMSALAGLDPSLPLPGVD
jgi:HEAT repeat protein